MQSPIPSPAAFIQHAHDQTLSPDRPKWVVLVPNPAHMEKLTRPTGWRIGDVPLAKFRGQEARIYFHHIANTNLCYSNSPCTGQTMNIILEFALGPPLNFLLLETNVPVRLVNGIAGESELIDPAVSRFTTAA